MKRLLLVLLCLTCASAYAQDNPDLGTHIALSRQRGDNRPPIEGVVKAVFVGQIKIRHDSDGSDSYEPTWGPSDSGWIRLWSRLPDLVAGTVVSASTLVPTSALPALVASQASPQPAPVSASLGSAISHLERRLDQHEDASNSFLVQLGDRIKALEEAHRAPPPEPPTHYLSDLIALIGANSTALIVGAYALIALVTLAILHKRGAGGAKR